MTKIFAVYVEQGAYDGFVCHTDSIWTSKVNAEKRMQEIEDYWQTAINLLDREATPENQQDDSYFWEGLSASVKELNAGQTNDMSLYLPYLWDVNLISPTQTGTAAEKAADSLINQYIAADADTKKVMRDYVLGAYEADEKHEPYLKVTPFS